MNNSRVIRIVSKMNKIKYAKYKTANLIYQNMNYNKRSFSSFSQFPKQPQDPENLLFIAIALGVCYLIVKR